MKDFLKCVKEKLYNRSGAAMLAVLVVVVIATCVYYENFYCEHEWQEATCTTPKTCVLCGTISGEPLGHTWQEATCTTPKICTVCRTIEGNPLGHTWQEATCLAPKTCATCHITEGEPLPHSVKNWEIVTAATCSQVGIRIGDCDVCNSRIQEPIPKLEHTPGDWQIKVPATAMLFGLKERFCTVCGEFVDSETYNLEGDSIKQWYEDNCNVYTYEQVARNPNSYEKQWVKFRGKVVQVISSSDLEGLYYEMRVNVTQGAYGSWTDTIYVSYVPSIGFDTGIGKEGRVLEGDIITLYGTMDGTKTYTSIFGASITIPQVLAYYIILS